MPWKWQISQRIYVAQGRGILMQVAKKCGQCVIPTARLDTRLKWIAEKVAEYCYWWNTESLRWIGREGEEGGQRMFVDVMDKWSIESSINVLVILILLMSLRRFLVFSHSIMSSRLQLTSSLLNVYLSTFDKLLPSFSSATYLGISSIRPWSCFTCRALPLSLSPPRSIELPEEQSKGFMELL